MALLFSPLPHTDAAERISSLPVLLRPDFDQLLPELRAYAFTVSGLTQLGAIVEARDKIAKVTTGETTWDRAKRDLAGQLSPWLDEKQALRRGELLLRTHTFRGYAAARYRSLMAQRDVFPYWQYVTHGDGRVRPAHAALNGKIFPAGHPIWQKIFPPWGWGCRCLIIPRMRRDVERIADGEGNKAPEAKSVWDGDLADAIDSADRLPSGISLKQDTNWNWKPGELRPDLVGLRKRYQDADPEAWSAFEAWATGHEITGFGQTPIEWLRGHRFTADELLNAGPASIAEATMARVLSADPRHPAAQAMKLWGDDEEKFFEMINGSGSDALEWQGLVAQVLNALQPVPVSQTVFRGWNFRSGEERARVFAGLMADGVWNVERAGMSATVATDQALQPKFTNKNGAIWEIRRPQGARPVELLFRALGTKYPHEKEVIFPRGARLALISAPERRRFETAGGKSLELDYYLLEELP